MGARQKLNSINTVGALAAGGIVGALTGSWLVFIVTVGVLVCAAISAGDIRPKSRRR